MPTETTTERSQRIITQLKAKYPDAECYAADADALHFIAEVEPTSDHPEYDRAILVIIKTKPHKHLKLTQSYEVLSGAIKLHVDGETIPLNAGEDYTIAPGKDHWAESDNEAWVEEYNQPGWTKADHISV